VTAGAPILFVVLAVGAPAGQDPAGAAAATLRCTNPFSGATRDIAIDQTRRTADSFPATITDKTIRWHDAAHGGNYELDRNSGQLTVVYASSTGGFFLRNNCRLLENPDGSPG
jgi:hypothetical protein